MDGWIKDYRKELDSDIWLMPPLYHRVWQYLKYMANHDDREIPARDGTKFLVKRGQHLTSLRQIAQGVGWYEGRAWKEPNPKTISTILSWLEKNNMITINRGRGNREYTLITLTNYSVYQDSGTEGVTGNGSGRQHLVDINKNDKNDKEDINNINNNIRSKLKFETHHLKLAELLFKKIRENNPNAKKPNLESWANTFRLMMERDGREGKEIQDLILWSQKHHFWYKNILSADKLRKQYDRLLLEMRDEQKRLRVISGGRKNEIGETSYGTDKIATFDFSKRGNL